MTLEIFESAREVQERVLAQKREGRRVGCVLTMGCLHDGHLSLIDLVREATDSVFVSLFVNPTQFNNSSDLERYPRDLQRDLRLIQERSGVSVYIPAVEEVYPEGFQTQVSLEQLSAGLEGAMRPGHFGGVTTVVTVLFNTLLPDVAVFGEKDFQQLRIIEQLVSDLRFPTQILRGKLIREKDGLAMSSRNVRLSAEEREHALTISRGLFLAEAAYLAGEKSAEVLSTLVAGELAGPVRPEYVAVVREIDLFEVSVIPPEGARILVAATVGPIRLIDNIPLAGSDAE